MNINIPPIRDKETFSGYHMLMRTILVLNDTNKSIFRNMNSRKQGLEKALKLTGIQSHQEIYEEFCTHIDSGWGKEDFYTFDGSKILLSKIYEAFNLAMINHTTSIGGRIGIVAKIQRFYEDSNGFGRYKELLELSNSERVKLIETEFNRYADNQNELSNPPLFELFE